MENSYIQTHGLSKTSIDGNIIGDAEWNAVYDGNTIDLEATLNDESIYIQLDNQEIMELFKLHEDKNDILTRLQNYLHDPVRINPVIIEEIHHKARRKPHAKSKPKSKLKLHSKTKSKSKPRRKSDHNPHSKTKTKSKPRRKSDHNPHSKTKTKSKPRRKSDHNPHSKTKTKSKSKSKSKNETPDHLKTIY